VFDQLYAFVAKQVAENELFSGGLILMLGGALLASCRRLPGLAWERLKSWWVIEIDILDRDAAFDWIDRWLAQHPYARDRARWLTVQTRALDYEARQNDPDAEQRPHIFFSPAPGQHFLFYRGRLVILNRVREERDRNEQA
jgi:chaperone BCS1